MPIGTFAGFQHIRSPTNKHSLLKRIDLFRNHQNISAIRLAAAVELHYHEYRSIDYSGGRRHCPTSYLLFLSGVV
jgi:hypothetical protein